MAARKNIYWVNAVRAFAIMAVYLSHVQASTLYGYSIGRLHAFLSPWYVNAFFFISGYLLFRKQLSQPLIDERRSLFISRTGGGGKFLSNIVCRIIIPTILFAAIEYVPNCVIRGNPISFNMAIYKTIGGGTYWFTSALAVSEIIILFLLISRKKSIWFYFIACILVGGLGMITQQGMYDKEIWAYHRGVIALIFIVSGGLFWNYEEIVTKYMKRYVVITMIAIYTAVLLFIHDNNPNISILSLQPWGIVTTLIGCVLLIEICKRLPENKALNYIGQNTLGFYFVCGAVPSVVTPFFHSLTTGRYL